ncbi:hypothetical protein K431DRAFT_309518, partial [Polychaeton citri CBS 116435]
MKIALFLTALFLSIGDARTLIPREETCDKFPEAGPVNPGQTNVHPCDTSFIRSQFPCSNNKTRPCLGGEVQAWRSGYMGPAPIPEDRYAKRPFSIATAYNFPVILSVTDTINQAEHFLVTLDGRFIGETGSETGYSNVNSCGNDYECAIREKYSRGYFLIPAGVHEINIGWPRDTGLYTTWTYAYVGYRFDRLCDPASCDTSVCDSFPGAGPVNPGQTNVYPCDTSFIREQFPCSETGDGPCTAGQVKNWANGFLPSAPTAPDPFAKGPFTTQINYNYPVILTIVDTLNQAEHFLVKNNAEFIGETGGETGYTNLRYCGSDGACSIKNKNYSRGYYLIPPGANNIEITWPYNTGLYTAWGYAYVAYRFDLPCNITTCLPPIS